METQRTLQVGIYSEPIIRFTLNTPYTFNGHTYEGEYTATCRNGKVCFQDKEYEEVIFQAQAPFPFPPQGEGCHADIKDASFTLHDVTIGVHFHWERKEDQTFKGDLRLIIEDTDITGLPLVNAAGERQQVVTAIDILGVEDYLTSVISSEMSATSSMELLKAHAVISRSWVLRPILNPAPSNSPIEGESCHAGEDAERLIKWYERDAHVHFDVCADDHCQRYQGITRQTSENVRRAIEATWGEVLTYDGKVCDARFYKACGGATELFHNCWADEAHPYLQAVYDYQDAEHRTLNTELPDLTVEENAERWIRTSPDAFCNTDDKHILSQVLNNYDQETTDFYRWTVEYTQEELSKLIRERSGIDFGEILDLIPIRRGPSARIIELQIVGTKRTITVGKELEIRKWLSPSHLYSSAFVVDKFPSDSPVEKEGLQSTTTSSHGSTGIIFRLTGAGWGHGVGLCQIGAAVMADKGANYQEILAHYFVGATLEKAYS